MGKSAESVPPDAKSENPLKPEKKNEWLRSMVLTLAGLAMVEGFKINEQGDSIKEGADRLAVLEKRNTEIEGLAKEAAEGNSMSLDLLISLSGNSLDADLAETIRGKINQLDIDRDVAIGEANDIFIYDFFKRFAKKRDGSIDGEVMMVAPLFVGVVGKTEAVDRITAALAGKSADDPTYPRSNPSRQLVHTGSLFAFSTSPHYQAEINSNSFDRIKRMSRARHELSFALDYYMITFHQNNTEDEPGTSSPGFYSLTHEQFVDQKNSLHSLLEGHETRVRDIKADFDIARKRIDDFWRYQQNKHK